MIDLHLIGIGTGNPDHLTSQAIAAMNRADLILLPRKGSAKSDLVDLRRQICTQVLVRQVRIVEFDMPRREEEGDYLANVEAWHDAIARIWREAIDAHAPGGGRIALLVWGDPSLYDSTLRIAARLEGDAPGTVGVHVTPGITSIQALTAAHALALNTLAGSVVITTGRRLRRDGWPAGAETVVVMLDGGCAFEALDPDGISIWWGAYLGMAHEALEKGPLAQVARPIAMRRAALRAAHGWIMDVYLLRREPA